MCLIITGITSQDCAFSIGGLTRIFLANKSDVTNFAKNATGTITGITMTGGAKFYEFVAAIDTSQLLEELQTGTANRYTNQTLNFVITNLTQAKVNVLNKLALAKVAAIIQYPDNTYRVAGEYSRGLAATALSSDSGTAIADLAGATISLTGAGLGFGSFVTSTAVTAVID